MEQAEFIKELENLEAFFEKDLSIEQAKDWYEELKEYSVERFRKAVRECKRSCKYFPKLAEFLAIISTTHLESIETEKVECDRCNGCGLVRYFKTIEGREYEFMARCKCQNANIYDDNIPKAEELIAQGYKTVFLRDGDKHVFYGLRRGNETS